MLTPEVTYYLAIGVFVAAAATVALLVWRDVRQTGFLPRQYPLYWFGYPVTRILWRAKVIGRMELPTGGGAVIVCNHRGPMDPTFVALACLRAVRWMVAREYFAVPIFGTMLKLTGAIPTRRGGIDTAAIKQTIRSAKAGNVVGVLPEGRINVTDRLLLPLRTGAALVALEARVPVVPCYIEGSPYDPRVFYRFFLMHTKATITIGKPIDITPYLDRGDERDVQEELTRRIGREIAALAGRPDYEPELVSRRRRESGDAPTS